MSNTKNTYNIPTTRSTQKNNNLHYIDQILTNSFFGLPIFILIMTIIYSATFIIGQIPQNWLHILFNIIRNVALIHIPPGKLSDLLTDGIIPGIGSIVAFLPIIMILMGCITILESTGYMSRAAFLMNKPMHTIGLNGQSFIPLILSTGCNVPAAQSTNIIKSKSTRIITILISPLISCTARLQVYVLLVGIFFNTIAAITVIVGLHLIGFLLTAISSKIFRTVMFNKITTPYKIELIPYKLPTVKFIILEMYYQGRDFLVKASSIILSGIILVWLLSHYPSIIDNHIINEHNIERQLIYSQKLVPTSEKTKLIEADIIFENKIMNLSIASYLGRQFQYIITPILNPDHKRNETWKDIITLTSGFVAKEAMISTMSVIHHNSSTTLKNNLINNNVLQSNIKRNSGLTPLTSLAFMLFIMFYTPCLGMLATINNETKSIILAILSIGYGFSLAWITAWFAILIGHKLGFM